MPKKIILTHVQPQTNTSKSESKTETGETRTTSDKKEETDDNSDDDLGPPDRGFAKRAGKGVVIVPFGNRNYMRNEFGESDWNKIQSSNNY